MDKTWLNHLRNQNINNTEILHTINKYTQTLRSRRKGVEMLLKKKSLKVLEKCTKNLIGHSRLAFNNHESNIDC